MRVLKKAKFIELKEQMQAEMGVPLPLQRYWVWAKRQNHTYRPSRHLTEMEDVKTMEELQKQANVAAKSTLGNLNLYLEESLDAQGRPQVRVLSPAGLAAFSVFNRITSSHLHRPP
jgi:ubiquitin carboxyl-terminal hydrolase 7